MATKRISYKYLILGCNKCRHADKDKLTEAGNPRLVEACTREGKRELGKDGSCKNRKKFEESGPRRPAGTGSGCFGNSERPLRR